MVNFVSQSNTGKTNNLFHYSCRFGTQTKKEEKMLTRIRVHFGNKMGGAGKGGIHFYKNWVNKKANHLSPETWMKPGEASAQNSIFFPSSGIFKPDVSLSKCQSQGLKVSNPIDRPLRMLITKSHRLQLLRADNLRSGILFFFGRGRKSAGQTDMYRDMAMAWSQASTCTLKEFFPW